MPPRAKAKPARASRTQQKIVDEKVFGSEPVFEIGKEIGNVELTNAYNWYNYMLDTKDAINYLCVHFKNDKKLVKQLRNVKNPVRIRGYGWLARIIDNGFTVPQALEDRLNVVVKQYCKDNTSNPKESATQTPKNDNKPSIQDKIREKSYDIIGDIENLIDENEMESLYDYMSQNEIPAIYGQKIVDHYAPVLAELEAAVKGKEADIKEAYACYSKAELKSLVKLYKMIVDDATRFSNNAKRTRKPRKKKAVSVDKKLANFKYQEKDDTFKIVSVNPATIIGARVVWAFNTKYKALTRYETNSTEGFDIKGTTLHNVDLSLSVTKNVGRKADAVIKDVLSGGKIKLRKLMDSINTKANEPNARINNSTIILKIEK